MWFESREQKRRGEERSPFFCCTFPPDLTQASVSHASQGLSGAGAAVMMKYNNGHARAHALTELALLFERWRGDEQPLSFYAMH